MKLFKKKSKTDPEKLEIKRLLGLLSGDPMREERDIPHKKLPEYGEKIKEQILIELDQTGILGPDEYGRGDMLLFLSEFPDKQVIDIIVSHLDHVRAYVRIQALTALLNIPSALIDDNISEDVKMLKKDKEYEVRELAAKVIKHIKS